MRALTSDRRELFTRVAHLRDVVVDAGDPGWGGVEGMISTLADEVALMVGQAFRDGLAYVRSRRRRP
jgi:hypothetical protein